MLPYYGTFGGILIRGLSRGLSDGGMACHKACNEACQEACHEACHDAGPVMRLTRGWKCPGTKTLPPESQIPGRGALSGLLCLDVIPLIGLTLV